MKHVRTHAAVAATPGCWPQPPLHVVLVEPEIPPNTGNIARLCAGTGTVLHLVEPLGFHLTDSALRRAGLDYWDSVEMVRHASFEAFQSSQPTTRMFFLSTRGPASYTSARYAAGDALVFGSESRGLPQDLLDAHPDSVFSIQMRTEHVRSLNLATSVGIVLYEALRQIQSFTPEPP